MTDFTIVIPARWASTRFPNKLMQPLRGKPILRHTLENAEKAGACRLIVATDHASIYDAVGDWGYTPLMTSETCPTGTHRLCEAVVALDLPDNSLVVNVQGDEPLIQAENIQQVVHTLKKHPSASVASLYDPIVDLADYVDPHVVKVVINAAGEAMYFSRAPIPYHRDAPSVPEGALRHIGLYAYRAGFLRTILSLPESTHARTEALEQLQWLQAGHAIAMAAAQVPTLPGVDTPACLKRLEEQS